MFGSFSALVVDICTRVDRTLVAAVLNKTSPFDIGAKGHTTPLDSLREVLNAVNEQLRAWHVATFEPIISAVMGEVFKHINSALCNRVLRDGDENFCQCGVGLNIKVGTLLRRETLRMRPPHREES